MGKGILKWAPNLGQESIGHRGARGHGNQILPRITSPEFLQNRGLGNEIGFWIFDYPPESELIMRDFLASVVEPALAKHQPPLCFVTINLFDLVIGLLEERNLLDKAIDMQASKGDDKALESLRRVLKEDKLAERIVKQHNPDELDLLMLTGVASYLIEKDYWLMHGLWALQQQGWQFQLKGGTSLSKGFGIIQRFSEDIDLRIESVERDTEYDDPKYRGAGIRLQQAAAFVTPAAPFPKNFLRHYYDLYCLLAHPEVLAFIGTPDYQARKRQRFRGGDELNIALNPAFTLSDPTVRERYQRKYEETAGLYYAGQVPFPDILARIAEHIDRL